MKLFETKQEKLEFDIFQNQKMIDWIKSLRPISELREELEEAVEKIDDLQSKHADLFEELENFECLCDFQFSLKDKGREDDFEIMNLFEDLKENERVIELSIDYIEDQNSLMIEKEKENEKLRKRILKIKNREMRK